MASGFITITPLKKHCSSLALIIVLILAVVRLRAVECVELDVGGPYGWATPPAKNDQMYNDWASKNRFQVNDTLRFTYKKDSVMTVTEEEYERCRSSHPVFFSNNGDTVLKLDRPGLFYFISGVSGHCQRGLKMVVKVLEHGPPPQAAADPSPTSAAAFAAPASIVKTVFILLSSILGGVILV
ncbi:UNVERIFIED_CONTAM: Early nodulin-like protein 1 [Sesamum angustifolium]|uniref:Early nodulin-like protein 1 n=1 Tax=Sesamum angustifolium TaxID=2727405 RepID=A0AAW2PTX7_9LAMI